MTDVQQLAKDLLVAMYSNANVMARGSDVESDKYCSLLKELAWKRATEFLEDPINE